jgi:nitronate monooxygenase
MWRDRRVLDLFGIAIPIVQAPMAGAMDTALAIAVARAGGLGSLPAGMLNNEQIRDQTDDFRKQTGGKPLNLNFFAFRVPVPNNAREDAWREKLKVYYDEFGIDPSAPVAATNREPFGDTQCELVEALKPEVVSFHYGLPDPKLVERVKTAGCKLVSSATTVAEARFLESHGCDAIIAQGLEAGGHRGMFLTEDLTTQMGTFALLPQTADALTVPVIASGGICDARAIAAALILGASAVQMGTAYLFCPEAKVTPLHRALLKGTADTVTVLTNVLTGRPARGFMNRIIHELGPMSEVAPNFPLASPAIAPLQKFAQANGSGDFSPMWAGQSASLGREASAFELTSQLAEGAKEVLRRAGRQ